MKTSEVLICLTFGLACLGWVGVTLYKELAPAFAMLSLAGW
jgi:hypothetical protein